MKRVNLLTLLFAVLITLTPNQALADIGGLTKCSESPAFTKRLNASVKKIRTTSKSIRSRFSTCFSFKATG